MKTDFDHLEMIYKSPASSDIDSCKLANCEDSVVLKNRVNYLFKTVSRFSMETANLNAILGS